MLTLAPVDPMSDLDLLVDWLTAERAVFWGMTGYTREEIAEVYAWLDEQTTHHAYLVREQDVPVALLQSYRPEADVIGEHYERRPGDLGMHLFLGPGERRAGLGGEVIVSFCRFLFADPAVKRLVVEPDIRNERAIRRLVRTGCELGEVAEVPGPLPELPGKTAQFAFLTRERFAELYGAGDVGAG